jgi:hypothetical protein
LHIALLTDFGTRDASVASIKAAILCVYPQATFADVCHHVPLHSQREAARLLNDYYGYFPEGTIHVAIVAPFVGKRPAMSLIHWQGQYFLAPDNGLLPAALPSVALHNAQLCYTAPKPYQLQQWIDATAGAIAAIANNTPLPYPPMPLQTLSPEIQIDHMGTVLECRIIHADRYGNLTLNINAQQLHQNMGNRFAIEIMRNTPITSLSTHYADVAPGMPLCRITRRGMLQIAVNHGSAAQLLGVDTTDTSKLFYHTIRVAAT